MNPMTPPPMRKAETIALPAPAIFPITNIASSPLWMDAITDEKIVLFSESPRIDAPIL